ncbi:LOW QUALITY PROTEIN: bcl-2-related protein A1-like [Mobula hypostoma]|uniref:LOW QUALITY PROTEIN: bcl-2-related protein A1-like n=1 Tax=Mobula hypostoma TaxID=723540 RepID=UPI002FC36DEC
MGSPTIVVGSEYNRKDVGLSLLLFVGFQTPVNIMGYQQPNSEGFCYFLADDYFRFVLHGSQAQPAANSVAETLRRSGSSLYASGQELERCIDSLNLSSLEEAQRVLPNLMREVYSDGIDNWGRIVTLFAFCGILVRHLKEKGVPERELVEGVAQWVAQYTWTHKGAWIKNNGGWEKGFVEHFQEKKNPHFYAKIAAVTGIVAAFSFVIYQQ